MKELGSVLTHLIDTVARAPVEDDNMVFSKLYIKDGYWCMIVEHGKHLNFVYVLLDVDGARIQLVTPSALQMGWSEAPLFFCASTETGRDIVEDIVQEPVGSISLHPLKRIILYPVLWLEDNLATTCEQ